MWSVIVLLVVGSCFSSAEVSYLTVVDLPLEATPVPPATPQTTPGSRIIGGTPATIERYPYAVQVLFNNQLSCGGTLLTRRHVMSAAHCFVDSRGTLLSASQFSCRVGTATLYTGGSVHRVSRIINHERYNMDAARDNDISVLLLATAVTLGTSVNVASIPSQGGIVPDNATVWVVGWGRTNAAENQVSTVLNEVSVYTINTGVCEQRYRILEQIKNAPFPVTYNMMCTGVLDVGGRDACQGDSGGPVIYLGVVVGVTSWGEDCAHPTYPGVNARVSAYTNWINTTITRYNGAPSLGRTSVSLLLLSFLFSVTLDDKLYNF